MINEGQEIILKRRKLKAVAHPRMCISLKNEITNKGAALPPSLKRRACALLFRMKRFIPAITLVTLLSLQGSLLAGWGSKKDASYEENGGNDSRPMVKTPGFNLEDNRRVSVELDYLFWRPQMEDNFFAIKTEATPSGATLAKIGSVNLEQPSYELSSGVRLGIGGYTSDSWDVNLTGTYLYSSAKKDVHAEGNILSTAVLPQWMSLFLGTQGTKGSTNWKMNFYTLDLSFGREYFMTKKFSVHPFIGLRGFHINQSLNSNYSTAFVNVSTDALPTTFRSTSRLNAKQNLWGIGPRLGIDLNFYLTQEWAFLGGFSGSLLYTKYKVKESLYGHQVDTGLVLNPYNSVGKDQDHFGRANLDVYFGLGWDRWFNQGKQRVSLALLFEGSQWFQINQWFDLNIAEALNTGNPGSFYPPTITASKRHGDLSFMGGTVRLNIDF